MELWRAMREGMGRSVEEESSAKSWPERGSKERRE